MACGKFITRSRLKTDEGELDELIFAAIESTTPIRNEFLQVINSFAKYSEPNQMARILHRFFETIIKYHTRPENQTSWIESEYDHFKFLSHELFLHTLSTLLQAEDYKSAGHLLSEPYYLPSHFDYSRSASATFTAIHTHLGSLERRNRTKRLNRLSLRADMIEQRTRTSGAQFSNIMQADFICFTHAEFNGYNWWPETLVYATYHHRPFEIFIRAKSKSNLTRILPVIGASSLEQIKEKIKEFTENRSNLPRWQHQSFSPAALMACDDLGTKT